MLCSTKETNYQLPDARVISLDRERFRCPEALFQPSLQGHAVGALGMHSGISLLSTSDSPEIRKHLYGNIVLSGSAVTACSQD